MNLGLTPLIGSAIDYSKRLLAAESVQPTDQLSQMDTLSIVSVNIPVEFSVQAVDNRKFEVMIQHGVEYLSELIEENTSLAVSELRQLAETVERVEHNQREQHLRNVIHEVQANINSLKAFLQLPSDHKSTDQLVVTALHPLQASLERARLAITEFGVPDLWTACCILGKTSLLAGFRYLNYDNDELTKELAQEIYSAQVKILGRAAAVLLREERTFPWQDVPHLLSLTGFEDLMELHGRAVEIQEAIQWPSRYSSAWQVAETASRIYELPMLKGIMPNYKWKAQVAIKSRMAELGKALV